MREETFVVITRRSVNDLHDMVDTGPPAQSLQLGRGYEKQDRFAAKGTSKFGGVLVFFKFRIAMMLSLLSQLGDRGLPG